MLPKYSTINKAGAKNINNDSITQYRLLILVKKTDINFPFIEVATARCVAPENEVLETSKVSN